MADQSHRCPKSCDTFIALPPATADGHIIFAKNSDRPANEVQEVVYFPEASYASGTQFDKRKELQKTMGELEEQCIMGMEAFLKDAAQDMADEDEIRELFIDCVETEMKFYK